MRGTCLILLAWLPFAAALAQNLPGPPQETYYQDDPAAVMPREIDPANRMAVAAHEQVLQYDPTNVTALLQNARLMLARGQNARAFQEFEYAIRSAPAGSVALRQAHWAYGWALLRGGEARRALQEWQLAAELHGGSPRWVPSTLALGFWLAGEKDRAVEYFVVAVRSEPNRWGTTLSLGQTIRDWHPDDRAAMEALHAEWKSRIGNRGG